MNMNSLKEFLIVFTIIFAISSIFVVTGSGWKKRLEEQNNFNDSNTDLYNKTLVKQLREITKK
jgi:hypothetical protein